MRSHVRVGPGSTRVGAARATRPRRLAGLAMAVTALGGLLVAGGCSSTPSATSPTGGATSACTTSPPTLTTVTGRPGTTLPPSHDNDVGRMRMPDKTPDNDVDANQVPTAPRCPTP